MIATDTSTLVALLRGDSGSDVNRLVEALAGYDLVLPPVVVTEILSDPRALPVLAEKIGEVEFLAIFDGYWERAGVSRKLLKQHGLKAKVADALIAQSCIDHDVPLITRDADFRHFAKHCGLKLA
jgi:predicted nucleic acid-binding protein